MGDLDKPKFVFFFDEAHLLFDDAPKALLERIEQVVRLIRSKGVGVYFITQNPLDVPESVLGQLGNRVQHALRAFTPKDQKAVKVAAETFRPNKKFNAAQAITELGVGEALVSFLDAKGVPIPVERCLIAPPRAASVRRSRSERAAVLAASPLAGKYDKAVDRASAYEVLMGRVSSAVRRRRPRRRAGRRDGAASMGRCRPRCPPRPVPGGPGRALQRRSKRRRRRRAPSRASRRPSPGAGSCARPKAPAGRQRDSIGVTVAKAASRSMATIAAREAAKAVFGKGKAGSIGASVGGAVLRGVLGSILR